MRTILLALGNDLLGDDAVGFEAARLLKDELKGKVDVVESPETGLALLDHLEGYDRALLIDAIVTGKHPPGTLLEFGPEDFKKIAAPSPHFAGLPELLDMAKRLKIHFPKDIRILAMEVENPIVFRQSLTTAAHQALPGFMSRAKKILLDSEDD